MLIKTRGLTRHFGGVTAVDDVDFTLKRGELRCLIGPNGAGKSTFFKMLSGQLRPSTGSIQLDGREITRSEPHQIARLGVGIKTQVPSVYDGLAVRENLELAALRQKKPKAARQSADEWMERLALTPLAKNQVGTLAHGQRQWVELGIVLAADPHLILLDEPAAGMTHEEVSRTAELIGEINQSHSLIVVEHDMQFIRMIASTVTVFHQGRIIAEDDVSAIMADPVIRDIYLGKSGGHA